MAGTESSDVGQGLELHWTFRHKAMIKQDSLR